MKNIEAVRVESLERIYDVFTEMKDVFKENTILQAESDRRTYAKKIYENGICVAITDNGNIKGVICGYLNRDEQKAYIPLLALKNGKGIVQGKYFCVLFGEVYRIAREYEIKEYRLEVDKENKVALNLYKKFGAVYAGDASDKSLYMMGKIDDLEKVLKFAERNEKSIKNS